EKYFSTERLFDLMKSLLFVSLNQIYRGKIILHVRREKEI
ncbi:MAG: hypothetical protein QG610_2370, partial [Euryarchaeota archaeon]|nr:hypothetical protein [Euryarchaeota archaeon]